jgi:hypothetical protein
MTLTTHGFVGAALGTFAMGPITGFLFGFVSHLAIDAIPHGHYTRLFGATGNVLPRKALPFVLLDGLLGVGVPLLLFSSVAPTLTIFCAIVGALLPDFLLGVHLFFPSRFSAHYERFHRFFHFLLVPEAHWNFSRIVVCLTEMSALFFSLSRAVLLRL